MVPGMLRSFFQRGYIDHFRQEGEKVVVCVKKKLRGYTPPRAHPNLTPVYSPCVMVIRKTRNLNHYIISEEGLFFFALHKGVFGQLYNPQPQVRCTRTGTSNRSSVYGTAETGR